MDRQCYRIQHGIVLASKRGRSDYCSAKGTSAAGNQPAFQTVFVKSVEAMTNMRKPCNYTVTAEINSRMATVRSVAGDFSLFKLR